MSLFWPTTDEQTVVDQIDPSPVGSVLKIPSVRIAGVYFARSFRGGGRLQRWQSDYRLSSSTDGHVVFTQVRYDPGPTNRI